MPDRDDQICSTLQSEPPTPTFLTIEDASRLTGCTPARLLQLARTRQLQHRGSLKDPLFPLTSLLGYRPDDLGALPDSLTQPDSPAPRRAPGPPRMSPPVFSPNTLIRANVLDVLPVIPKDSVAAVVCSPPYWGQRVYEGEARVRWADGCLVPFGRESTPEEYVAHTLEVLKKLLPVMRADGTIWWNVADTYMTRTIMRTSSTDRVEHYAGKTTRWAGNPNRRSSYGHSYLRDKDLALVPFQIAIGAQKLGYYLRSVIVWSKQRGDDDFRDLVPAREVATRPGQEPNRSHVPEVVTDRPVTGHEYILLLTRSERYQYHAYIPDGLTSVLNVRTVWTFPPVGVQGNHGARFPDELPRRCVLLATSEGDLVFDPFAGQGTTMRVARDLKRQYFGCDISDAYVRHARRALRPPQVRGNAVGSSPPDVNGRRPVQPPPLAGDTGPTAKANG